MAPSMYECCSHFLKRFLLLLLAVRVIAAPIALQPAPADDPDRSVVVVRRCAWPARPSGVASVRITEGRDGRVEPASPGPRVLRSAVSPAMAAVRPLSP